MPTTEIPPRSPLSPSDRAPRPDGSELYDAHHWESAYREMHHVPTLLIQLQDDLSRSRQREAFWISVVVHLILVILIINSPKFEKYLPKRAVLMVSPNDLLRQKELTYLELPPDTQKVPKRPESNIISDKDRMATSRTPQLNREELKKILDSARSGAPGPGRPPAQQQQPTPPAPAGAQNAPAPQQSQPERPPVVQDQVAKLQPPPVARPKPSFGGTAMSPGSAIEQAARAAAANRGGYGESGDYGLGAGRQPTKAVGALDVLSDTMGVDFSPYLARVLHDVRENWYRLIPESAQAPLMKKGKVSIEFAILKDGRVTGMQYISGSGDVALDRAAYAGITASNPFPPLPNEFGGQYLALRFHFFYNPDKTDLQ
jgi:TonB family protein